MSQKQVDQVLLQTLFAEGGVSLVSLSQAVRAFLHAEMVDKSPETAAWYEMRLLRMAEMVGAGRPLGDVFDGDLLAWYADLAGRRTIYGGEGSRPEELRESGLSPYTLHGYVRACKRFFGWLVKRGVLQDNPAKALDLPKLPRSGRKGISERNLRAILEAAKAEPRDYALLRFLESTGVRRGGAANLLLSDLNLDHPDPRVRRRASVREKGDKERTVVMSPAALDALEAWLAVRPELRHDEHVFLGRSPGQPWHGLSPNGISAIVKRYKQRLGLRGNCSPHEWRHRWARHMLQKGMELSQVSQLIGHEDVSTTVRFYGQFTIDQLQEAYDKFTDDPLSYGE